MDLHNRIAVITGASSGIGASTARAFVREGAKVVLIARTESALRELSGELGENRVLVSPADITRPEQFESAISRGIDHFGKIDILVNNAGVGLAGTVAQLRIESFERILKTNVLAPLRAMQQVIPHMRLTGGGLILNVSSMITRIAVPNSGGYRASKMALDALSESARIELYKDNIRVITVYPGLTATPFFENVIDRSTHRSFSGHRRRAHPPELVANKIVKAAQCEPRTMYMGSRGFLGGKVALLFPGLLEWLIRMRDTSLHHKR